MLATEERILRYFTRAMKTGCEIWEIRNSSGRITAHMGWKGRRAQAIKRSVVEDLIRIGYVEAARLSEGDRVQLFVLTEKGKAVV